MGNRNAKRIPPVWEILKSGGPETKCSALMMGLGNLAHKQVAKGLVFLAVEAAYVIFMLRAGFHNLAMLPGLGSVPQEEVWNEELQVYLYTKGDQSIFILLYGLATILVSVVFLWIWRGTLRSAYCAETLDKGGHHVPSFGEDLKSLLDENLHRTLMTPPMFFITALTILPLLFMICMAFTNYSKIDNHLVLFDWVGQRISPRSLTAAPYWAARSGAFWSGRWFGRFSQPSPTISLA